jgi:DnaJ-class molecular chaperone
MKFQDYYATLNVEKKAEQATIKQAYRRLARKYHPDMNPNDSKAEAKFKNVTEAYEVLGDPEKRQKYDKLGANWRLYEQARATGRPDPFAEQWSASVGGAGRQRFHTVSSEHMEDIFGQGASFSDFFTAFFGSGAGQSGQRDIRQPSRRGRDVESTIEISLEEAYTGTTRRIEMRTVARARKRSIEVRIPAGIANGARVRVNGEGESGVGEADAGDLFLRIHVPSHSLFKRRGSDLEIKLVLPITTAVLGGDVDVPSIAGKPVTLRVAPLTQSGRVFRIRGYGMPNPGKEDSRGDAYARVEIQVPTSLSEKEREHYEALSKLLSKEKSRTT